MRVLLIDGQWNLKRNFYKRRDLKTSTGHLCGGSFGFIDSLRAISQKVLPDRIVVMWDGFHSGKLRYEIYPPYKANRNKDWEITDKAIATDGLYNHQDLEKVEFLKQKIQIQNYLDELFIRQVEVDLIEADDLIAQYVLRSESDDDEIIIYSRDRDYLQLISDKVSIVTSDSAFVINKQEYESKNGHTIDNELLFKCFEGDSSDKIEGVKGINRETLIKYFPNIAKEKYLYSRLVEESIEAKKKKKLKIYDKIVEAQSVLYRNARLMNLKKPFLNEEAISKVDAIKHGTLGEDRSIENAVSLFIKDGMIGHLQDGNLEDFFSPFYRIMTKEIEYSKKMKI
jgi:DNA polymerase-1